MSLVSVIIPTYNEVENLPIIIPAVTECLSDYEIEIIVCDDSSPDDTFKEACRLSEKYPVVPILRKKNRGLSAAVIDGMEKARGNYIVVMDADMSHPVEKLPEMITTLENEDYDIVVGSRYCEGGDSSSWSLKRVIISRVAGAFSFGLTKLTDPTSGFMAVRSSVLDLDVLNPIGWKIVLETVVKSHARVTEVPITFKDRFHGKSKLDSRVQLDYLAHVWSLHRYQNEKYWRFASFCLIGLSGFFIDSAVLFVLVEFASLEPQYGVVFSFSAAVVWNYLLNRRFTFDYDSSISERQSFIRFFLICVISLVLRTLSLSYLLGLAFFKKGSLYLVANLISIVLVTVINFIGSRQFAFPEDTR